MTDHAIESLHVRIARLESTVALLQPPEAFHAMMEKAGAKPVEWGDDSAATKLSEWARGFEYYYDAYYAPDAAFPDQLPSAADLAEALQYGARLVPQARMAANAKLDAANAEVSRLRQELDSVKCQYAGMVKCEDIVFKDAERVRKELAAERVAHSVTKVNLERAEFALRGLPEANDEACNRIDAAHLTIGEAVEAMRDFIHITENFSGITRPLDQIKGRCRAFLDKRAKDDK